MMVDHLEVGKHVAEMRMRRGRTATSDDWLASRQTSAPLQSQLRVAV